jgi:spore coat polysaccharide biosynthesis predicted glycosyltransferase SpsG
MRCLALAQAWSGEGGTAVFLTSEEAPHLLTRIRQEGFGVRHPRNADGGPQDARETVDAARALGAAWVVVDGYHFDYSFQVRLRTAGCRVLVLDDHRYAERFSADVLLNQNVFATPELYRGAHAGTRVITGARYAMIRREFLAGGEWERAIPPRARRLLVTLGGGGAEDATRLAICGVGGVADAEIETVVLAAGDAAALEAFQRDADATGASIQIRGLSDGMPRWLRWADLAVTAAGSTCWEMAFLGLPSLTLVLAENQRQNAERLDEMGICENLGWENALDAERMASALRRLIDDANARREMSRLGRELFDGQGAARVVRTLQE